MAKPKRAIAFYGLRKRGDAYWRFTRLADGLAARGVELTVISRFASKLASVRGIDFYRLERPFGLRRGAILAVLQLLLAPWELIGKAVRRRNAAIIVFDPVSSLLSVPASLISWTPIELILLSAPWKLAGRRRRNVLLRAIFFLRDIAGLCLARRIIVSSVVTANDILSQFDLLKKKIVIQQLPITVNSVAFGEAAKERPEDVQKKWKAEHSLRRKELLDRYDLPEKAFIICSFAERRDYAELEVVFRALSSLGDDRVHLLFLNNGKERNNLASITYGLGISDRVQFVANDADFPLCIEGCDLCFVPGGYSGTSELLLKALGSGVGVLAADSSENREVLVLPELLVESSDVEALASRIRQVRGMRGGIDQLRAASQRRASELVFDWTAKMHDLLFPRGDNTR